ncbi:unnamed protein product [Rhizophagus irregularis]|nr:unnamed protein product [Rhizophagus irregularis]
MLSSNKHLGNNQLPVNINLKEHNLHNIRTSEDTVFRYYEDTDMLSIYFAYLYHITECIKKKYFFLKMKSRSTMLLLSLQKLTLLLKSHLQGSQLTVWSTIVSVDIYEASELLCCRLFETSETIDNKPPFAFYPEDRDVLFIGSKPLPITFEKTENKDFEVGINDEKLCYFTMQVADCLKRYRRRREKNLRKKRD